MMKCAMKKKITSRLLAVALVLMTAMAFMPVMADAVWGADDPYSDPTYHSSSTTDDKADSNGNKKPEFVVNVSFGDVTISGTQISYWYYDTDEKKIKQEISNRAGYDFYNSTELVITGKSPSTFYKVGEDIYLKKDEADVAAEDASPGSEPEKVIYGGKVKVIGKDHPITLCNLNMEVKSNNNSYLPIEFDTYSSAIFSLQGTSEIKGKNAPAIYVPGTSGVTIQDITKTASDAADEGSTVTVSNTGTLKASTTGSSAAAIGAWGEVSAHGNITINSGIVEATGCGAGAGIGGSGSGSGDVIINGGDITAIGGSYMDLNGSPSGTGTGAPGIGSGSTINGGSVTITGGNIKASGGTGITNTSTHGIASSKVSSNNNTVIVQSSNGIYAKDNAGEFNGIVWLDDDHKNATVYGDALIANKDDSSSTTAAIPGTNPPVTYPLIDLGDCTLTINGDATLSPYPEEKGYKFSGTNVTGNGHLIGTFHGDYKISDGMWFASLKEGYNHSNLAENQHKYIHVRNLDYDVNNPAVYDGRAKMLTRDLIQIDEYTTETPSRKLDTEDWERIVYRDNTPLDNEDEIIDAGNYSVSFVHKYYGHFDINGLHIAPKPMTQSMVQMDSPYSYGEDITYSVVDGSTELTDDKAKPDYTVKYYEYKYNDGHEGTKGNEVYPDRGPLTVGSYAAVFTASDGNYTTNGKELIVPFIVEPASIQNADVKIYGSEKFVYNGDPQNVKNNVTVTLNGNVIDPDDYEVTYENDSVDPEVTDPRVHYTDAGYVTATITPVGEGLQKYSDTAIYEFTIQPRPVKIKTAVAAYTENNQWVPRRNYDGTNLVNIIDAKPAVGQGECVIEKDKNDVSVDMNGLDDVDPSDDLKGKLSGSDVGTYKNVTLSDVRLTGSRANNYVVAESSVTLSKPEGYTDSFKGFEITQLPVPTPTINVTGTTSAGDKEKFLCTVKVTNAPNGAMYLYGIAEKEGNVDNIKWQTSNEFDGLTSNTDYWFYCKVDDESEKAKLNLKPEGGISWVKYKTPLIPQDPPAEFDLEITLDPNGETYTVTIPEQEGAQYSFDGKNFNKTNVLKKVGPNVEVTGYARFPATKTHAISEAVSATDITPPLTVKTPVISPENGAFYGSVKVTITCPTDGATIYYTTDGNHPTESDEVYKGAITVTEDTTISAIAVKRDMEDSEMASVDYVYTEFPPTSKSNVTSGVKVTNDLKNSPSFNQKDSITAALSRAITEDGGGYTYQNIAYYDLQVQLCFDGTDKNFVRANADNFPEEGVEITIPVPKKTSTATHDYRVAHMFSETSDRLGITAGEIEMPEPTESGEGLTITVTGCSPIAIGWVETADENAPGADDENADDENADGEGGEASEGDEADRLNANGENADGENAGANGEGAGANGGANGEGAGADGENADGAADDASGAGGVVDELVNAVTTGDYTNPILWAAIALVSLILLIIIVAFRRRA